MSKLTIGRLCDHDTLEPGEATAVLSADRLTQHAVCLGMTGSGKTGLCVSLLEEVALAGVPILAIDPKGDLANLALAFPDLEPADFRPWVDPGEASRKGISVDELATRTAKTWKEGLASWGIGPDRVRAFAEGTRVTVLTPGSHAGLPVDVLAALASPPDGLRDDAEGLRDYTTGATTALLGLVGVDADPLRDPEAILLARLLGDAWAEGRSMPLEDLLPAIVDPPFEKVGVFPLDTFFPRKSRLDLAMRLNAIVASPAFAAWREGVPLDVESLLAPDGDRTQVRVLYLAHLDDTQRMFFITMLLHAVVAWSRRQPGTGALRALVYFDEVMGYLPPHPKSPPSKGPVLTLMKQARAVGVGTMLCTQNPVDVDYKALSNAGSWWIGRLQTAQDRERVVDGLVAAAGGLDRGAVDDLLKRMPPRTFLWRDVKSSTPTVVHSRWAMSFLRGPLTRREVEQLGQVQVTAPPAATASSPVPAAPTPTAAASFTATPPPMPADLQVRYLDPAVAFAPTHASVFGASWVPRREDGATVWLPALYAAFDLTFDEGRSFRAERREHRLFFPLDDPDAPPHDLELPDAALRRDASGRALYAPLPVHLDEASELSRFHKALIDEILRGETTQLFRHAATKLESRAGETREAFEARVVAALREAADARIAKLKDTFEDRVDKLEDKLAKATDDKAKYETEASSLAAEELVGAGEMLMSLFMGRRRSATSVVSRRRRTMTARERIRKAEEAVDAVQADILDLREEAEAEVAKVEAEHSYDPADLEVIEVTLERTDLRPQALTLVWVPVTRPV